MAGYEDVNDAERLSTRSDVPADRFGEDLGPWGGATSRLQSFQTDSLAREESLAALAAINRQLIVEGGRYRISTAHCSGRGSTEIPVYGQQE
jgi:hypothetical protein